MIDHKRIHEAHERAKKELEKASDKHHEVAKETEKRIKDKLHY